MNVENAKKTLSKATNEYLLGLLTTYHESDRLNDENETKYQIIRKEVLSRMERK